MSQATEPSSEAFVYRGLHSRISDNLKLDPLSDMLKTALVLLAFCGLPRRNVIASYMY
jgi:hypothetical protein